MKRIFALVLAVLMLCASAALAEKVTVFTDAATGWFVTLEMQGDYTLEYDKDCTEDFCQFDVIREGVNPVTVLIWAKDTEEKNMNDWTEEETATAIDYFTAQDEHFGGKISMETTPAGNKYLQYMENSEEGSYQERYTIFEDFDMNRCQFSTGTFTDEDIAFMDEVQGGLWVTK